MKKIIKMPKIILTHGLTAVLLFVASFFISDNLDISLHDAYYTMSKSLLIVVLAMLFGVFAATVWGIEKILIDKTKSIKNWFIKFITKIQNR